MRLPITAAVYGASYFQIIEGTRKWNVALLKRNKQYVQINNLKFVGIFVYCHIFEGILLVLALQSSKISKNFREMQSILTYKTQQITD